MPTLLSLIYEERFALTAAERGLVAAGVEPLPIVGVVAAMPLVARLSTRDPGVLLRHCRGRRRVSHPHWAPRFLNDNRAIATRNGASLRPSLPAAEGNNRRSLEYTECPVHCAPVAQPHRVPA